MKRKRNAAHKSKPASPSPKPEAGSMLTDEESEALLADCLRAEEEMGRILEEESGEQAHSE